MKLGSVTKLDKRNKTTSKKKKRKTDNDVMSADCDVTAIFPIYGQFGAILKLDSRHIVCKLTFSQIVPFYLTKTENRIKKSNTALTLWL